MLCCMEIDTERYAKQFYDFAGNIVNDFQAIDYSKRFHILSGFYK